MKVETVPVDSLSFDPNNARKHNPKNLEAIKGSLKKFGQQKPIVVDGRGIVLAGNGTLQAIKELGWSSVNVVRSELSNFEASAYALADNRTAELATWDEEVLGRTLQYLREENFAIEEIGFELDDMSWQSDLDKVDDHDDSMTGLDEATFKIKCHKDDADEVKAALREFVKDCGLEVTLG